MKDFHRVIREVNLVINSIVIFDKLLDALIVFLSVYLFSMVIGIFPLYALIPAAMFFIITVYLDFDKSKALMVEQKYPQLNERLRTAFDNVQLENDIVSDLEADVTADMKKVKVSSFIDTKKTTYKSSAIVGLCFVILLLSALGVHFLDIRAVVKENFLDYIRTEGSNEGAPSDKPSAGSGGKNEDIYGEKKLAELGSEEVELKLKTVNFEVLGGYNINEAPDVDFQETFPDTLCASTQEGCGSEAYSEDKTPIEHAELVKKYFLNIAK